MPTHSTPPVYEVEFILAERRLIERRSQPQQLKELLPFGERRTSPERRKTIEEPAPDIERAFPL